MLTRLPLDTLRPHPDNPRLEANLDVVDRIAVRLKAAGGFDDAHALMVRPLADDAYQIVSGHHRALAAAKAKLKEVPCWVRTMSDEDAYMALVLANTQSALHPLEEGRHALNSGLSIRAYAQRAGKKPGTVQDRVEAAKVAARCRDIPTPTLCERWSVLALIHRAPEWIWPALAAKAIRERWTVETARLGAMQADGIAPPPEWAHTGAILGAIGDGSMKAYEVGQLAETVEKSLVRDPDLRETLIAALHAARPTRAWQVQALCMQFDEDQWARDQKERDGVAAADPIAPAGSGLPTPWSAVDTNAITAAPIRALSAQALAGGPIASPEPKTEEAEPAVLHKPGAENWITLDEWAALSDEERALRPMPAGRPMNERDGPSSSWARWSWDPVTGCRQDCPYCDARDLAERSYPQGFGPSIYPERLSMPANTPVPTWADSDSAFKNVLTCSMADLFGRWVPAEWIGAVLDIVRDNPQWNSYS